MNVTPAEFRDLWFACNDVDAGSMNPADFERWCESYFGCRRYTTYRVVVRYDVPAIPWYSWGVARFEVTP